MIVRRIALYCACDHDIFIRFKISSHLNNVLGILRDILVLLAVAFWKNMPSVCPCSETQEFVSSMT